MLCIIGKKHTYSLVFYWQLSSKNTSKPWFYKCLMGTCKTFTEEEAEKGKAKCWGLNSLGKHLEIKAFFICRSHKLNFFLLKSTFFFNLKNYFPSYWHLQSLVGCHIFYFCEMTQPHTAPLQQNKNNDAHQAFSIYWLILKGKPQTYQHSPEKITHVAEVPLPLFS